MHSEPYGPPKYDEDDEDEFDYPFGRLRPVEDPDVDDPLDFYDP